MRSQGKRVGVYMDLAMRPKYDQDVLDLFMKAIEDMEAAGAEIIMNVSVKVRALHTALLAFAHIRQCSTLCKRGLWAHWSLALGRLSLAHRALHADPRAPAVPSSGRGV